MATAWAPIHVRRRAENGEVENIIIQPGDTVNKGDLPKGDYDLFMRERILRDQDFPEGVANGESVRRAVLRKAREDYESATAITLPEAYSILDPAPNESETTDDDTVDGERQQEQVSDSDINRQLLGN